MELNIFASMGGVENLDLIFTVILILMAAVAFGGIIVFALILRLYRIRVRVRRLIKGRTVIQDDKAREKKDKDGNYYLKLLKIKEIMEIPPADAIDTDRKGRLILEVIRHPTGEYQYITNVEKTKPIPKEIINIKNADERKQELEKWKQKEGVIHLFQPFTSTQRATTVNQVIKAQQRKSVSWMTQLPTIVSIGALVVILISLFVFYGEIASPVLKANDQVIDNNKVMLEQLKVMNEIKNDIQTIKSEQDQPKEVPN